MARYTSRFRSAWKTIGLLALTPMTGAVQALLNLAILLWATAHGQLAGIAGYSAGLSVGAYAATIVGGGTSLVYVSGDHVARQAVRKVRFMLVVPTILFLTAASVLVLPTLTDLDMVSVLCGGMFALLNNLSEIETAYLRRELRTRTIFGVTLLARGAGLTAIVIGAPFALAMLISAVVNQVLLQIQARDDPTRTGCLRLPVRTALKSAYDRNLYGLSICYVIGDRTVFLVAPMMAQAEIAGAFSSMLMLVQSFSALLVSGLNTVLAARSSGRVPARPARAYETISMIIALALPSAMFLMGAEVVQLLGVDMHSQADLLLVLISLGVPISVFGRLVHFRMIYNAHSGVAFAMALTVALGILAICLIAYLKSSIVVLALAIPVSEAFGVACGLFLRSRRRI